MALAVHASSISAQDTASAMLSADVDRGTIPSWLPVAITVVICLGIIACFSYFTWKYLVVLRRASQALKHATAHISGEQDQDPPHKIFPNGPERLRELWAAFLRERKDATVEHEGKHLSTVDPAEIFHDEAVFDTYNRNFAVTLAGFFTGLGILGTFLGLVIGLSGLDTSSIDQQSQSVNTMLSGMATAFITSLVGITASLVWLFLDRALFDSVQRAATEFFLAVRSRYPVESADRLLHHLLKVEQEEKEAIKESKVILEEHRKIALEQKGILQVLGTDLAVAFQEALSDSLERSLGPQMTAINQVLQDLSANFGERQVEALEHMVESFQRGLSEHLYEHLAGLSEAMERAATWQEVIHGELRELTERLQDAAKGQSALMEATSRATERFEEAVSGLAEIHESVSVTADSMKGAAEGVAEVAGSISGQAEALQARIDEMDRQHGAYREANEELRLRLAEQIDGLDGKLKASEALWDRARRELDEVAQHMKSGALELSTLTEQALEQVFKQFDSEMASVVRHLSGTIAEIRDVTEDLPRHVGDLTEALTAHSNGLTSVETRGEELLVELKRLDTVAQALGRLAPLADSVGDAASRLERAAGNLQAPVTEARPDGTDGAAST